MREPAPRDEDLMAAARRGDAAAFERLVARHTPTLFGVFRRLGADAHAAEDCVQETFLRLLKSAARYRPDAPFRAFLLVLARNAFIDAARRHRETALSAVGVRPEEPVHDAPSLPGGLHVADVRDALAALPEAQRLVLQLAHWDGLRYREIAALLDVPVGTVKSRVFHAVRRLREALRHERTA